MNYRGLSILLLELLRRGYKKMKEEPTEVPVESEDTVVVKESVTQTTNLHFSGSSVNEAWKRRRWTLWMILVFTAFCIIYVFSKSKAELDPIHGDIISALLTLDGFVLMYWFFGSMVDDHVTRLPWGKK